MSEGEVRNDAHQVESLATNLESYSAQVQSQLDNLSNALTQLRTAFRDDRGQQAQKKLRESMDQVSDFRRLLAREVTRLRELAQATRAFNQQDRY
jgi:hypothetical protein